MFTMGLLGVRAYIYPCEVSIIILIFWMDNNEDLGKLFC